MMSENNLRAEEFLNSVFKNSGLDLRASGTESEQGCVLDLEGDDAPLLRGEGGELLGALEHIVNQIYGRSLPHGQRFVCDVDDFRATREAELRAMAHHAAERVRSTRAPFNFGPMEASERRVIPLELAREEDLHTESVGEGNARRLRVSLKSPGKE